VKTRASADRFVKYGTQRTDSVVDHCRCVSLLVAGEPILAIPLTHFSDIGFQQRWPGAFDKAKDHLAIVFRSRFKQSARPPFQKIDSRRVANRHFSIGKRFRGFVTRTMLAHLFGQSLLRYRENGRLKALPDWFVTNLEPREVRS